MLGKVFCVRKQHAYDTAETTLKPPSPSIKIPTPQPLQLYMQPNLRWQREPKHCKSSNKCPHVY